MTAEPAAETAGPRHAVRDQRFAAVIPFLNQRLADAEAMALDGGAPVGADADLRKPRDLLGERLRLGAGSALGGQIFAQADRQAFLGRHLAPRQNDFERAALPDNARQP